MAHHSPSFVFQKPATNNNPRITNIEDNLLQVQREILSLTTAVADCGDRISSGLSRRIIALEDQFQELQQQLVDEHRESTHLNEQYDNAIQELTNKFNILHTVMESRSQEVASGRAPIDIANEIRSRRFTEAEALMLNTKERIPNIVHEVYASSQENTDIILDYADALTKIEPTARVLSALKLEMRANNHRNPYKMMKLVQTLQKGVVNQSQCTSTIKRLAEEDVKEIHSEIVEVATETLQSAMYSKKYQNNVDVEKLANALHNFNSDVSDKVMQRVVKEVYTKVPSVKIADDIYSNKYISQIVVGLVALFKELKRVNDLNNKAVLSIGYYLKCLVDMKNYKNISEEKKKAVNEVIDAMPICAKNLFFEDTICIWNKRHCEYLYAAGDAFMYDRDRRSIFTWRTDEQVTQGDWIAKKNDDLFTFENVVHKDEYMYAAAVTPYNRDRRYVLTWVQGGTVGKFINGVYDKSAWNVELCGDYCYLCNEAYNEYLYASEKTYDSNRRYVFTWIKGASSLPDQFKWQIRKSE